MMPKPRPIDPEPPTIWPTRKLASAVNVTPAQLSKLVADGVIKGKARYGEFDAVVAVASYCAFLEGEIAGASQTDDDDGMRHARRRWFETRAARGELELAQLRGAVVPVEAVQDGW